MYSRTLATISLGIAVMVLILGCSTHTTPTTPDTNTPSSTTETQTISIDPHQLWGLWQVRIEAATGNAEVVPLRTAMWHLNTMPFLEKGGHTTIQLKNILIDGSSVELNVGLAHPFPGLYQWSGFDVRGIFISDGSFNDFVSDGDLITSGVNEPRLLDADGWTRWWNPEEFPSNNSILGYKDGVMGVKDSQVNYQDTLNPYKYFSDDLSQNEDFPNGLDFERRGIFTANMVPNWRHYSLDFGHISNWYIFNYAVDACHMFSESYDGHSIPSLSQLPDPFFPIEANIPEPFAIKVTPIVNTLYYADPTHFGGDLVLSIDVYDWQGMRREGGIPAEIEDIRVESPTLLGYTISHATVPGGGDPNYSTYKTEILGCHPDGQFDQTMLITVVSKEGNYTEGYDGFKTTFKGGTSKKVSSYLLYTPPVSPEIPTQNESITVISPNGSEIWNIGTPHAIQWYSTGNIPTVRIELSKNSASGPWNVIPGASGLSNTGSWSWTPVASDVSTTARIRVVDTSSTDINDMSDGDFEIFDPTNITITSPNGGEVWVSGSSHNITWTSGGTINFVRIDYSDNNGGSWNTITATTENDGVFEYWNTSAIASTEMLVRIYDAADLDPYDTSDAVFAVEKLTLTKPNTAADDYEVAKTGQYITWTIGSGTTDVIANINIEFSKNGGSSFSPLVSNVAAGSGQWQWVPVLADVTTQGRIRITAVGNSQLTDTSDANFEVFQKHELTLTEYLSWFTGGARQYRGRYASNLSALSQNYYNGTITNWNFTTTPLSTYVGTINCQMSFSNTVTRVAGAPVWGSNNWGMRTTINGPASRRAWWVFQFDSTGNKLYNRGSTYYQDATFDDISLPGFCLDYVACNMTEQFGTSTANAIQFPQDQNSATKALGGSGYLYWVNYDMLCSAYNDQWNATYNSGSEWDVVAFGSVTTPHGGGSGTTYPYCLLIKVKINIGDTTYIVHTGQLFYQWVDTDSGLVVAFIWTHNEGNSISGIPYTTGFNGDAIYTAGGIIGAYN